MGVGPKVVSPRKVLTVLQGGYYIRGHYSKRFLGIGRPRRRPLVGEDLL